MKGFRMKILMKTSLAASLVGVAALFPFALPVIAETDGGFIRLAPDQVPFKSPLGASVAVDHLRRSLQAGDLRRAQPLPARRAFEAAFPFSGSPRDGDQGRLVHGDRPQARFRVRRAAEGRLVHAHPANGVHWDGAGEEEVIVQIVGIGPVTTTPVDAVDAPDNWPKPK